MLGSAQRRLTPFRRRGLALAGAAAVAALFLFLPWDSVPDVPPARNQPFAWNQDATWKALEQDFLQHRARGCPTLEEEIERGFGSIREKLENLPKNATPDDPAFTATEALFFALAARVAACPDRAAELASLGAEARATLKRRSIHWKLTDRAARARLYRSLYGARAAVEEVLLQADPRTVPALLPGTDEPSEAPKKTLEEVELRSGDILLSRGGAPTSALIARGSDYPGNFSHVALLHIDESGTASVIEAHIESGVVVSSVDEYLRDKKLRVMVLRLRADLPAVKKDPLLAHRAATAALSAARGRHIPYDFAMDTRDPRAQFCSEVASSAYEARGVTLWQGLTTVSAGGLARWLASLGVRHFETHGPSDLEYDPQLRVVAEWRDPAALFDDHVDNALLDAMLEDAEAGEVLTPSWPRLPLARLAKAWSVILNLFGGVGPIPEGMSATVALRVDDLRNRHARRRASLERHIARFRSDQGYTPPYWELLSLARRTR